MDMNKKGAFDMKRGKIQISIIVVNCICCDLGAVIVSTVTTLRLCICNYSLLITHISSVLYNIRLNRIISAVYGRHLQYI